MSVPSTDSRGTYYGVLMFILVLFLSYVSVRFASSFPAKSVVAILVMASISVFCFNRPSLSISIFAVAMLLPVFVDEKSVGRLVNLGNLAFIGAVFFVLLPAISQKKLLHTTPIDKWVLALIMLSFVGALRMSYKDGFEIDTWLQSFLKPIQSISIYYFIVNGIAREDGEIRRLLNVLLVTAVVLGLFMIRDHQSILMEKVLLLSINEARTGGATGSATEMSLLYLLLVPTAIVFWSRQESTARKLIYAALLTVLILAIVFTYARIAYLALVFVICGYYLMKKRTRTSVRSFIKSGLIAVPFAIVLIYLIPTPFIDRVKSIANVETGSLVFGSDTRIRVEMNTAALRLLYANPHYILVGGGWRTFEREGYMHSSAEIVRPGRDPHNLYLRVLMDTGLIGAFIYSMLLLQALNAALRLRNSPDPEASQFSLIFIPAAIAFLFCSLLNSYELYGNSPYALVLWAYMGILMWYQTDAGSCSPRWISRRTES